MIRRHCCKKCNYTFILMSPFICPSCTHNFIIIIIMKNCRESHGNRASALSRRDTQFPSFCDLLYWWSKEEELQEEIKRKTGKIIISVNHQYFLGGCIHGVNKLVGRTDVSLILLLPPTVYSLSSLSSANRESPALVASRATHNRNASVSTHSILWLLSLSSLIPFLSSDHCSPAHPSQCHHPPRFHHSSLHPGTLAQRPLHATTSTLLLSQIWIFSPNSLKGPQLAFLPLCLPYSKREITS